ncbi:hypothetical protein VOLCADRAFT_105495 [Volvox carteri f. nagariensis]|uniref:Uncharacterized protein n=1 Tax=Volvox carteri f. nagariensis TaxID=3068 RepID=D8U181_VOLCA|nr:uncharacterized protein VOLCADRAFT_105495 [Volvox carteri f. nagariensis]EFJ46588.1 hypothetical protein VOLCADRAFT_105495 [Volvox carteri f. nagariensis]|eukprot:XP_002952445.1 hypothetical protein VOLCADRAFT_105495 [Volvox carteri f. nagariensis]
MQVPSAAVAISTDVAGVEEATTLLAKKACAPLRHRIRKFDLESDLQDLTDICANVYGGTDYMPRIIHRIAKDPGVLVLAAESLLSGDAEQQPDEVEEPGQQQEQQQQVQRQEQAEGTDSQTGSSKPFSINGISSMVAMLCRSDGMVSLSIPLVSLWQFVVSGEATPYGYTGCGPSAPPSLHVVPAQLLQPQLPTSGAHADPPASSASTPVAAATPRSATAAAGPIRQIVTCTVTYNTAAQRIIGRQLSGPLYEVEIWPGPPLLEEYEAAGAWVRGVGLKPGTPSMIDWLPNVREVLGADVAAQALLPHWRRVTSDCELRAAVAQLLYGRSGSGTSALAADGCAGISAARGADGLCDGGQDGASDAGPVTMATSSSGRPPIPGSLTEQPDTDFLWLPMPYDLWPLEGAFIQRELAEGNIWLLAEPATEGSHSLRGQVVPMASAGTEDSNAKDGAIVGVMVLTHFETLSRVCAGILARNNAVVHAAIAHAGRLQPHFMASVLRVPAGCKRSKPALNLGLPNTDVTEGTVGTGTMELVPPSPVPSPLSPPAARPPASGRGAVARRNNGDGRQSAAAAAAAAIAATAPLRTPECKVGRSCQGDADKVKQRPRDPVLRSKIMVLDVAAAAGQLAKGTGASGLDDAAAASGPRTRRSVARTNQQPVLDKDRLPATSKARGLGRGVSARPAQQAAATPGTCAKRDDGALDSGTRTAPQGDIPSGAKSRPTRFAAAAAAAGITAAATAGTTPAGLTQAPLQHQQQPAAGPMQALPVVRESQDAQDDDEASRPKKRPRKGPVQETTHEAEAGKQAVIQGGKDAGSDAAGPVPIPLPVQVQGPSPSSTPRRRLDPVLRFPVKLMHFGPLRPRASQVDAAAAAAAARDAAVIDRGAEPEGNKGDGAICGLKSLDVAPREGENLSCPRVGARDSRSLCRANGDRPTCRNAAGDVASAPAEDGLNLTAMVSPVSTAVVATAAMVAPVTEGAVVVVAGIVEPAGDVRQKEQGQHGGGTIGRDGRARRQILGSRGVERYVPAAVYLRCGPFLGKSPRPLSGLRPTAWQATLGMLCSTVHQPV